MKLSELIEESKQAHSSIVEELNRVKEQLTAQKLKNERLVESSEVLERIIVLNKSLYNDLENQVDFICDNFVLNGLPSDSEEHKEPDEIWAEVEVEGLCSRIESSDVPEKLLLTVLGARGLPVKLLDALAKSGSSAVLAVLARYQLEISMQHGFLNSVFRTQRAEIVLDFEQILMSVLDNANISDDTAEYIVTHAKTPINVREYAAKSKLSSQRTLGVLAIDRSKKTVRLAVVENPNCSTELLISIAGKENGAVEAEAKNRLAELKSK